MTTVTLKHRHRDRDVKVTAGPNHTRPPRPRRKPRVGQERLGFSREWLLERSLTTRGKSLDRATCLEALSLTRWGSGRSIEVGADGSLSCALRIVWAAPVRESRYQ